jgi:hypothetical protein
VNIPDEEAVVPAPTAPTETRPTAT